MFTQFGFGVFAQLVICDVLADKIPYALSLVRRHRVSFHNIADKCSISPGDIGGVIECPNATFVPSAVGRAQAVASPQLPHLFSVRKRAHLVPF